mmetsp:Transcript_38997/g.94287  ORF Transcript_38997/g.94287 Transcript_38997/m.94287 type:complete len:1267 (+) Transcript_38997:376-4176(+)|eukprot:CAMPEP_0113650252 /NCGR_PEP_ID=MMETSP0017_2-20120614/26734_1 /TAXON_ID=2856 /ORGANISM="Cylindrotheca closterium" /LENGTH=1266 /DNA_ID=CAMNT_0000562741 /DNA_START=334 /DNA_END=4134 /DNA_ORIENTATION=- /assembly_acc=CAM_ASM_000147
MQSDDLLAKNGIPMFGKNGMVLRKEQREELARKRGQCTSCGIKIHIIKVFKKVPVNNYEVWKGICVRCFPSQVPNEVAAKYQKRMAQMQQENRNKPSFGAVAHTTRMTQSNKPQLGGHNSMSPVMSPITGARPKIQPVGKKPRQISGDDGSHGRKTHGRSPRSPKPASTSPTSVGSSTLPDTETYKTDKADSKSIAKDLAKHRSSPDVSRTKLHALRNLSEDRHNALKEVKTVMEKHHMDARLMAVATGAVWSVGTKSGDKKKEILDAGFADMILDLLREPAKEDAVVAEWALGAITSLAFRDDIRTEIANKDGVEAILGVLERQQSKPTAVEWGCRALASMVDSGDEKQVMYLEKNMATIENKNGIAIVAGGLKFHIQEPGVQWWALRLMFRLLDRTESDMLRVLGMMNDADIGSICVSILSTKSKSPELIAQAAEMLFLLLVDSTDSRLRQTSEDCISNVMSCMGEHADNAELIASCTQVLRVISRGSNQAKSRISEEASGLFAIMTAMSNAPENQTLCRAGLTLFWMLSSHVSSFEMSLVGAINDSIQAIVEKHPDDVDLKTAACGLLANVLSTSGSAPEGVTPETVLKLSANTHGDSLLEAQVKRLTSAIYMKFPDFAEKMLNDGLAGELLGGLCDQSIENQMASAITLTSMVSSSEAAKKACIAAGTLETAAAALLATTSESLAEKLLHLLSAMVVGGKKIMQLPSDLIQAILQVMESFTSLDRLACTVIRNAMLVVSTGTRTMNCDGLCQVLVSAIDSPSSQNHLLEEACLALWVTLRKQPQNSADISIAYQSMLKMCSKQRALDSNFDPKLSFAIGGTLTAVLDNMRDMAGHITEDEIDLIVNMLDLVIEYDVENFLLMEKMLEVTLSLCVLKKDIIIQFGVIVVVIDCMVEHEGNERIQGKGCAILALLASTENLQVNLSIAETDGIDMLVSALASFSENMDIQIDTCKALSHLSIDQESRMLISSQGGLILLVNAMTTHKDSVSLLECAMGALLNLSADAEEQVLASSNMVDVIVRTMNEQLTAPRLQEKALGVLQNMSMRSREAKRAIANAGGIGAITVAIREFMGSSAVLERAFTTLWSLGVLSENQVIIANEGGIDLIINGMMANITFEKVQKQACGCLATVSANSDNKTLIRDLGGLDAIVYAMWAHYNSQAFLVEGCRALSALAVNVQTNEVMICSEAEISAITASMKRFPHAEKLQEHSCVAMRNFSLSPDNVQLMLPQAEEITELMNRAAGQFPSSCGDRARQVISSLQG